MIGQLRPSATGPGRRCRRQVQNPMFSILYLNYLCALHRLLETEIPLPGCLEEAAGLVKSKEEHVGGTFIE